MVQPGGPPGHERRARAAPPTDAVRLTGGSYLNEVVPASPRATNNEPSDSCTEGSCAGARRPIPSVYRVPQSGVPLSTRDLSYEAGVYLDFVRQRVEAYRTKAGMLSKEDS
jgi:hypothetical protein